MQQCVIILYGGRDELIVLLPVSCRAAQRMRWYHCYQGSGFTLVVVEYSPHLCGYFKLVLSAVTWFVVGNLCKKIKII